MLGNADIHIDKMRAIAHDDFGFEKSDFEFITDYQKLKIMEIECIKAYVLLLFFLATVLIK